MKWKSSLAPFLLNYFWKFKLTPLGRVLVASGILSGFFIGWSIEVLTLYLFTILLAAGILSMAVNYLWRTRFEVTVVLPDRCVAGATIEGFAVLRNTGRMIAYDVGACFADLPRGLRDGTPCVYTPALKRGEQCRAPLAIHALRRGAYALPPLRAFTAFPFRLLRSGASRQFVGNLLVLPAFTPLESVDAPVSPRYQPGGVALTSNIGESPEYIGNREFRPGDSIRRLDMRAWARIGAPVVREYQEEYFLRVALVLDTYVPRRLPLLSGPSPELEAGISLTAALVDALSRGEYLLDIFAAGPMLYNFRTGRGVSSFENVLEILACLDACTRNPFDLITPALADELCHISTVLFIFLDWDDARREMVRTAVERGCRTRVFIVRSKEPTQAVDPVDETVPVLLTPEAITRGEVGTL